MEKLLISACLLGENCRYDGGNNNIEGLMGLGEFFDLVPVCPEQLGGLPTPRIPSERKGASVLAKNGKDVTENFHLGAGKVLSVASYFNIRYAVLKENSPSCGVHQIHDGSFRGKLIDGEGVTTSLLRKNGIKVFNETEALEFLETLRARKQKKEETKPQQEEPEPVAKPKPERRPQGRKQGKGRPSSKPKGDGVSANKGPKRGHYRTGPRKWVQPRPDRKKK